LKKYDCGLNKNPSSTHGEKQPLTLDYGVKKHMISAAKKEACCPTYNDSGFMFYGNPSYTGRNTP
jgi:hypothetical protein